MDRLAYAQLQDVARFEELRVIFRHATIVPSGGGTSTAASALLGETGVCLGITRR
jgi:hypothetical protein